MIDRCCDKTALKDFRTFGTGLGVFLGLFAFLAWRKGSGLSLVWTSSGILVATIAWLYPRALRGIYVLWMRLARIIARVNTFVILVFIFYGVVAPLAVIGRLMGRDFLDRRRDNKPSYWKNRETAANLQAYKMPF